MTDMAASVTKWGNSLAIRIPQHIARELHIFEGTEVELSILDGSLVINPKKPKKYTLDELVAQITPLNRHAEIDTGEAIGKEIW